MVDNVVVVATVVAAGAIVERCFFSSFECC